MKTVRIFLFVLILVGIALLCTQNIWVPKLVNYILLTQNAPVKNYFGNEATGDLNGDGLPDTAFIFTQDGGGSGTFFYVAVHLNTATNGYKDTNAVFLGDRIAPQTTEIKNGELIVNYADRRPTDPMTTAPSVGVTKYLKVFGTTLSVSS